MSWVRRHPFATTIFTIILIFFVLAVVAADPNERSDATFGLILIYLLLLGLYLFLYWLYRKTFGRRREATRSPSMPLTPTPLRVPVAPVASPTPPVDPSWRSAAPSAASPPPPAPVTPPPSAPPPRDVLPLSLTLSQLEEATRDILEAIGFQDARRVGGAVDLSADILYSDAQGRTTIVECKRYPPGSTVGTEDIQRFIAKKNVQHQVEQGVYVTTTSYSPPAIDLARQHEIALIDSTSLLLLSQLTGRSLSAPSTQATDSITACPLCGNENPTTAHFCDRCGTSLPPASERNAGRRRFSETFPTTVTEDAKVDPKVETTAERKAEPEFVDCPRCHSRQAASVRFCTNCGLARNTPPR